MRVNLSEQSAGGGGNTPEVHEQNPSHVSHAPPPAAPAPAPEPAPAAPPAAATTVINAEITEDTIRLKEKLQDTEKKLKQREIEHASLSDEHQRYKDATEARNRPQPVPVKTGAVKVGMFRRGGQ